MRPLDGSLDAGTVALPRSEDITKAQLPVAARVVLADNAAEVRVRGIHDREAGRRRRPRDVVPVGTIDKVEDLRAELQPLRAVELEVLEERDVPLLLGGVVPCVPRRVAEGAGRRCRERSRVEPEVLIVARSGREAPVRAGERIADEIVRLTEIAVADAGDVVRTRDRERRSRPEEGCAGNLPPAEDVRERRVLVLPERQIVDVVDVQ